MMAGGYIAVLLTNWRWDTSRARAHPHERSHVGPSHSIISNTSPSGTFDIDRGFGATWAKMGSAWVIAGLYLWTLAAPIVWPSRFGTV
jgi:hypothetical protein